MAATMIFMAVFCGSSDTPCPPHVDPVTDWVSLVSGAWLPIQTFQDKHTFCSCRKFAGLAVLNVSIQLALEDMMEAYLAQEQLAAKWCMLLGVMHTAVYYMMMLLAGPLRLRSEHVLLSRGLLSILASSMCSVTKDAAKASVSLGMSPWLAVLVGSVPCVLWFVIVLVGVVTITQKGYEWELFVLLLLRVIVKAAIISVAIRKGREKRAKAAAEAESGTAAGVSGKPLALTLADFLMGRQKLPCKLKGARPN